MITWEDFNYTNKNNKQIAFENMCRVFFNYYFFNNQAVFVSKKNNPGIEIEPIANDKGERISFQAKYVESNGIYSQIKESMKTAVKHYSNRVDVIYLFTNKDLDIKSDSYKEILDIVNPHKIELRNICNQSILNIIETHKFSTIKELFFGKHEINATWFENNLKISLEDLEPRYVKDFNIDTDIQDYFELKYMSDEVDNIINGYIEKWSRKLDDIRYREHDELNKNYSKLDVIIDKVKSKVNKLLIPEKNNFKSIFDWYKEFENEKDELNGFYKELQNENGNKENKNNDNSALLVAAVTLLGIIENINLAENPLFKTYKSNVLIIEGEAGVGKSQLLGYEADKHRNTLNKTILLLGQKLMGNESPLIQLKEQLHIPFEIEKLFTILEGLGEVDNSNTVIMIDALNESCHSKIWKNYFNNLISEILKYKHIKLITTIRSSYLDQVLSPSVIKKIEKNEVYKIRHVGFIGNMSECIKQFFEYYKIPLTSSYYLDYKFANPLFLKIYCEVYRDRNNKLNNDSTSIIDIFNNYIATEENKIKEKLEISDDYHFCRKIIKKLAAYMFTKNSSYISRNDLVSITKEVVDHHYDGFFPELLKSPILLTHIENDEEIITFGYEKMMEFFIAEYLVKEYSLEELKDIILNNILKINKKNFEHKNAIGLFGALSILVSEKYGFEIIQLVDKNNFDSYCYYQLINEYISNLPYRNDEKIDKTKILECLPHIKEMNSGTLENFYDVLLILSGRKNNELNANFLYLQLKEMDLNIRDRYWTISINNNFLNQKTVYNIINILEKNGFEEEVEVKKLYLISLTWLLTSSNRELRDRISKILVKLLKNDFYSMCHLIDFFYDVNDPYIVQRLYGIVYGAVLESSIDLVSIGKVSEKIYNYIFNKKTVYPDILLRDYALNILEYANHVGAKLPFKIENCRPPYRSQIPDIVEENVENEYKIKKQYTGLNYIIDSLRPNIGVGMYGDFGRYVFEHALSDFKGVDIKKLYLYALYYIKNELKYENEFFSDYDKNLSFYYGQKLDRTERIGKKYEWIAFYRILALVSDNYKFDSQYSYHGSWNPYVRDFDPTLNIKKSDNIYSLEININQPRYNNWSNNKDWALSQNDVFDSEKYIFLKDDNENKWILLHGFFVNRSSNDVVKNDYKEVWRRIESYVTPANGYCSFINELNNFNFLENLLPEAFSSYKIFNREYYWSPAYFDESMENVHDVEIETDEKIEKKIQGPIVDVISQSGNLKIVSNSKEIIYYEPKKKKIGKAIPLWCSYSWEESRDASKEVGSVDIKLPCKELFEKLGLEQRENGIFYKNDEIVAVDFSLVKGKVTGLYIKENLLNEFLKDNNYKIFWSCYGEKNDIKKKDLLTPSGDSKFKKFSSLIYRLENGKIKSRNCFDNKQA